VGQKEVERGARHAGWLFVAAGLIGLAYDLLPGSVGHDLLSVLFDAANVAVGLLTFVMPWRRWPPATTLVLPAFALLNLAVSAGAGVTPEATYGVWYVLVFVWIGLWQPPRTVLLMAPLAALAYSAPFALGAPGSPGAIGSVLISIPVAALVGHTIARSQQATRRAQSGQAEAMEALARASITDDLTGLGNRRHANTLLDALQPGDALAILDLDLFKQVNDTLGHQRGDQVLQAFAAFLDEAVRDHDTVARLGGEEFILVLQGAGAAGVDTVRRLLDAWRATRPLVTFSAGVACHEAGTAPTDTLGHADAALYEAKSTGRNRVVRHGRSAVPADVA